MNHYKIYTILIVFFFFLSCENKNEDVFSGAFTKGELGITEIASITSVKDSTATLNCIMSYKGKGYLLARGICWSTTALPTIDNGHAEVKDTGTVTLRMSKLIPGTLYYVRPYITNNEGTAYGNELSFTTKNIPTATIATSLWTLKFNSACVGFIDKIQSESRKYIIELTQIEFLLKCISICFNNILVEEISRNLVYIILTYGT